MTHTLITIAITLLIASAVRAEGVAVPKYVQAPSGSSLVFGFDQAGAASEGTFRKFSTTLSYDEKNLAASSLALGSTIGFIAGGVFIGAGVALAILRPGGGPPEGTPEEKLFPPASWVRARVGFGTLTLEGAF